MRTYGWAREAILTNQGTNWFFQVPKAGIVRGILANATLKFPQGGSGFTEAFVNVWVASGPPQFSQDQWQYYQGPPPPDWGNDFVNLQGPTSPVMTFGDGLPVPGCLYTDILGALSPEPVNKGVYMPHAMPVLPGWSFVLHMDAQGVENADVEVGFVIQMEV